MLAAALAPERAGASRIVNVPENADVLPLLDILPKLGVTLTRLAPGEYLIRGQADGLWQGGSRQSPVTCDVKESGTLCRLLAALLNSGQGFFHLRGTGRLHERPLGHLGKALQSLGCHIEFLEKDGFPPLLIKGLGSQAAPAPREPGGHSAAPETAPPPKIRVLEIAADESSQYVSALLMLAPLLGGLRLIPKGRQVSRPYIDLTLQILRLAGIEAEAAACPNATTGNDVTGAAQCFTVLPGAYRPFDYVVEGDWSGAAFLLAAGALGAKPARVSGLQADSAQADKTIVHLLQSMGAGVEQTENAVTVYPPPPGQPLRGVEFDLAPCPDLAPVAACLAARANGESLLKNVGPLRIKESDRLAALQREQIGRAHV